MVEIWQGGADGAMFMDNLRPFAPLLSVMVRRCGAMALPARLLPLASRLNPPSKLV